MSTLPKLTLEQLAAQVQGLPPLPQAVVQVSRLLEQEDSNADDLAQIIRLDPDLTSQLLKLSNSAYYGLSRQIGSIKEAVAILGFKTIKSLVYAILSHTVLNRPVQGYGLGQGALWQNALVGAVYSRHLAQRYGVKDVEAVFTAALLRDLGKLVLEKFVGEAYSHIDAFVQANRVDFCTAEEALLGFNHTQLGQRLALDWNLPTAMALVARYHHTPSQLPEETTTLERKTVCLVHMGDVFSIMMAQGVGNDGLMYGLDNDGLALAGIKLDGPAIEHLLSELFDLQDQIDSLASSLGL